ncbi:hypothetical protein DICA4_F35542 [Diutina catenulata]
MGKFEDIAMLDIPDDEESMSSDVDSGDTSNVFLAPPGVYPDLQQWIKGSPLKFEFSQSTYDKSREPMSEETRAYVNYVGSMFKAAQGLDKHPFPTDDEPIGLVSQGFGLEQARQRHAERVNEVFATMVDHAQELVAHDPQFDCLRYIMACLQANEFVSPQLKPEMLCNWINQYDPQPPQATIDDVMVNCPEPHTHPDFWSPYITTLVVRGLHDQAVDALRHSGYESLAGTDEYDAIADLITILENYKPLALKGHFTQWKSSAVAFRDSLGAGSPLLPVASILTGSENAAAVSCPTWYDLMLVFAQYKVRDDESLYRHYYKLAVAAKPVGLLGDDDYGVSQQCFLDCLDGKWLRVLECIHRLDGATCAYVAKLLSFRHQTYPDYFVLRHAYDCLNLYPLNPVGIGILSKLEPDTVAEFLPHYAAETNDDLEWALTVCADLGLVQVGRRLIYEQGLRSLDQGYLSEALMMLSKAYDPASSVEADADTLGLIHTICWEHIFATAVVDSRPVDDEFINNIVKHEVKIELSPVVLQCLSPYAVLYEFFESLATTPHGKVSDRLHKLVYLLRFNYLPKKFIPLLLCQFLPFLLVGDCKFELPDLIIIVEMLDNYQSQVTKADAKDAADLFQDALDYDGPRESYDWRSVLERNNREVPQNTDDLVMLIRNEVTKKVGEVYIS